MTRPRTMADEDVLAAAADAVAAVGPGAITLAEIGRQVGLSPATLLQRFGSKRGLLLALAQQAAQTLPRDLRQSASASAPVAAMVNTFAELAAGVRTSSEFANHLAFLLLDLGDPDFRDLTRTYALAVEAAISDVLAAGQASGELLSGPLDDDLPRLVHAAYNGALLTWGMTGESEPAGQVRRHLHQILDPYLAA
ncbi:TetR family transcriptional regulator [Georgenia sp. Z1344]|uniref:TetR family transcriptional regulator n=1 Tax=Georgenia sp. Z1344 TaxID=3416706 RepID=UPI003CEF15A6